LLAGIDAHMIAGALGEMGLGAPVAAHLEQPEADMAHQPPANLVADRQIAIDAAPDVAALGAHRYGLLHHEGAVGANLDGASRTAGSPRVPQAAWPSAAANQQADAPQATLQRSS
jgi:hypothetical protein